MSKVKISDKRTIETGIVFGLIALFTGLYTTDKGWFIGAAGILLVALLFPLLLKPLAWLWFRFSTGLGWLTSRIVLFIIFWILVTPMGLIRRWLGKDSLRVHQFKKGKVSAFVDRNHEFTATDLKYPF